jgi:hypothetical protein
MHQIILVIAAKDPQDSASRAFPGNAGAAKSAMEVAVESDYG